MKRHIFFLLLVTLLCSITSSGWTKVVYQAEAETQYKQGVKLYQNADYKQAVSLFSRLVNTAIPHQRITASYLLYGKSLLKTNQAEAGILALQKVINVYPTSDYLDDAHFEMGSAFYQLSNYLSATREMGWVLDYSSDAELQTKARQVLEFLLETRLDAQELFDLLDDIPAENMRGLILSKLVQKNAGSALYSREIDAVVAFTNEFPSNPLTPALQNILDQASVSTGATVKIGVILPLKAGYSDDGMAILNGIRYAKQEYESTHAATVELIIRDSGSNVVTAVKAARELVADPDIVVIIGELESGITAAIGAAIAESGVPLVAPVASQHGLASLGENIFQANADWYHRGHKMAEYAIKVMGLHTFASIAPADQYGKEIVEGFTATVKELGGELIVEPKWYYQGSKDLSRQLKDIREKGLELLKNDPEWMLENSMLLAEAVKDTFIVPITSIDGLFCPVYTEDIQYVGAQCASLNLRMQMLGGDYWNAPDVLRNSQKYVNGVVFVSDYFIDEFSADYRLFVADFRTKMRTDFGHMQAFGYDVMKVMLGLANGSTPNRSEFSRQLKNVDGFPGLKNRITWRNHDRVNTEVNIVNYQNGKFQKLK